MFQDKLAGMNECSMESLPEDLGYHLSFRIPADRTIEVLLIVLVVTLDLTQDSGVVLIVVSAFENSSFGHTLGNILVSVEVHLYIPHGDLLTRLDGYSILFRNCWMSKIEPMLDHYSVQCQFTEMWY